MVDLSDPGAVRRLLKKLWCHGQAIAPLQGLAYGYWAIVATEAQMALQERILLVVSACVLPVWGLVSWRMMKRKGSNASRVILWLGTFMQCIHIAVVVFAAQKLKYTANLVVFIFTLLHLVETSAYMLAVCFFRSSLEADATDEEDQLGLLD